MKAVLKCRSRVKPTARREGFLALAGVVALALAPVAAPPYYAGLMIPFFGFAIALFGFNLLFGATGLLSFGHAMFIGIGAYAAAVVAGPLGIKSFEAALLLAAMAAMMVAVPVGLVCVRNTGIFFSMLTLAFGMLFYSFLFKFYHLTGGDSGMRVPRMTIPQLTLRPALEMQPSVCGSTKMQFRDILITVER
jgi:branched-chain amino acid transport system permease protein